MRVPDQTREPRRDKTRPAARPPWNGQKAIGIPGTAKPVPAGAGGRRCLRRAHRPRREAASGPPRRRALAECDPAGTEPARGLGRRDPSPATVPRFVRRLTGPPVPQTVAALCAGCLARLAGDTLDRDSRGCARSGTQEGVRLAEARCLAPGWLRRGNPGRARGATAVLADLQARRLALEALQRPYSIAARFTNPRQAAVSRLACHPFAPGLEVGDLGSQVHRWTRARRLLGGREAVTRRPTARGRAVFPAPGDCFHAVGTPRPAAPVAGWPTSNGRAATEHRR